MIRLHGERKEPCRTCQASLSTTLRRKEEMWGSLRQHKLREAHILWLSHLLVCVLQISLGRPQKSGQGLVKVPRLTSDDVVEPYVSFRQKTLW